MSYYVQYGCGLSAPKEWINFDVSPTLRIQRTPFIGSLLKGKLNAIFPENVKYGDIVKGLPVKENSCDGVFCSHTLEHLSLNDFRTALNKTYLILKPGGIFRCIVPDLEIASRNYIDALEQGDKEASIKFLESVLLGVKNRPRDLKGKISSIFGNAHHLWMWDKYSLSSELDKVGFKNIRQCFFNDSTDAMFKLVEDEGRFCNAIALECTK